MINQAKGMLKCAGSSMNMTTTSNRYPMPLPYTPTLNPRSLQWHAHSQGPYPAVRRHYEKGTFPDVTMVALLRCTTPSRNHVIDEQH